MTTTSNYSDAIERQIYTAFFERDSRKVLTLLDAHPANMRPRLDRTTWLHEAARINDVELIDALLKRGLDINDVVVESYGSALTTALTFNSVAALKFLLEHGADPNTGRSLIGAINYDDEETGLQIVKLLVEHGADINRVFPWGEDEKLRFTPLSWAVFSGKHEIAEYLRSKGAQMPPGETDPGPPTLEDQVIAYFAGKLGPVEPLSQQEIVPTGLPIAIHVVPPSEGRNHITLFTTGMSQQPMQVPEGAEHLQYAELAINLPADWPLPGAAKSRSLFGWLKKSKQPDEATLAQSLWPFQWLRIIARYPHEHQTWLGGAATIFANGDPPQPLAPGVPFTSFLLMNTDQIACSEERVVQIYQLIPLYTEERALEMAEGMPALLQALDRHNISWVVDLRRPIVGLSHSNVHGAE